MMEDLPIKNLIRAHATLVKMFYRRYVKWYGRTIEGVAYHPTKEITSNQDLLDEVETMKAVNTNLWRTKEYAYREIMEGLSGIYYADGKKTEGHLIRFMLSLNNEEVKNSIAIASEQKKGSSKPKSRNITVIYSLTRTPPSKLFVEQAISAKSLFFEVFSVPELIVDRTEHVTVPPHRLIRDPEERKKILDGYSLTEELIHKLPHLVPTDMVCKYFAFPLGALVEITRPSPNGPNIAHRVVGVEKIDKVDLIPNISEKEVVSKEDRKTTKYMSPAEYAIAMARTTSMIARSSPPPEYLESGDHRILQIARRMVDDQNSDIVVVRQQINSNKEEHWKLTEMVLPKVS
jgi:DNA-directed RNA polymerase subunit H (RpoH/RPB5)